MVHLLQHREAAFLAGLQTTSASCMADQSFTGVWESGKHKTLPTFPHPRLRRRADNYLSRCATLTLQLVQITGPATLHFVSLPRFVLPTAEPPFSPVQSCCPGRFRPI